MEKFLKRFLLFISLGLIIFVLLYITAEKFDPLIDSRIKQLLGKTDSIQVLAVGNSHTCAFDFEVLKMNGYRVAQGGSDIFEAEYIIKSLVPLLPNLEIVLFNISYFSLFVDNSALPDYYSYFNKKAYESFESKFPLVREIIEPIVYPDFVLINTKELNDQQKNQLGPAFDVMMSNVSDGLKLREDYYNSIPAFNWVRGDFLNYSKTKLSYIIREDHWQKIIYNIFKPGKLNDEINKFYGIDKYGQFTHKLAYSYQTSDSLDIMAKEIQVPMYTYNYTVMSYFNNNILNSTTDCLISIIKFLRERNIRLIFITTPVYNSFTKYYDQEPIETMRNEMHLLEKNYKIIYHDFSRDSLFAFNNKFFYNSDHLNKDGAKEFSKKLEVILENQFLNNN